MNKFLIASRSLVKSVVTGNNAHSVAVDPATQQVYLPISSATSPGGCSTCVATNAIASGGVLVLQE